MTPLSVMDNGTDLFYDHASIDYPILDCDAHVNEPPDTWVGRVPAKYKDRAPEGGAPRRGRLLVVQRRRERAPGRAHRHRRACRTSTSRRSACSYESMRPGSFDTKARLADMDIDGMYLQVLYPSVTLLGAKIYGSEPELQVACVRAYNDWLAEFCEGSDGRLIGQAHPADDRRRRHRRRDEALPRPRPPRRGDLGVPQRLARRPLPRTRRSGRSRRRPTRRSRCTSAASCPPPARRGTGPST